MRTQEIAAGHPAVSLCIVAALCCALPTGPAEASPLSDKARESKCVDQPVAKGGELYSCSAGSGVVTYFNVPGANESAAPNRGAKRGTSSPSPAGFPRVTGSTQKLRDEMRKKVLSDELSSEQKLLADARGAYADGAPVALPEERADTEKYRARIGKLRQAVTVHERNIEALKKELSLVR